MDGAAAAGAVVARVLEQELAIAHESRQERQAGAAYRPGAVADRTLDHVEGRQPLALEPFDPVADARDQPVADPGGESAVDHCGLELGDRDGGDDRVSDTFGRLVEPGLDI